MLRIHAIRARRQRVADFISIAKRLASPCHAPDLPAASLDPQPRGVPEIDFTYMITPNIDIDVDATITTGAVTRTTRVPIDPVIVGVGVGYRF